MKVEGRKWLYLIGGLVAAITPILVQLNILSGHQAENTTTLFETLSSLLGGGAALTAGAVLSKQQKAGLPELVNKSPVDLVVDSIPVVLQQAQDAQANVDKMRQAAEQALGQLTNLAGVTPFSLPNINPADPLGDLLKNLGR